MSGRRILAIDLDPQFALTRRFGRSPGEAHSTAFEVLAGEAELENAVLRGVEPGVDVLAARRELSKLELTLAGEHHREEFLADALDGAVDSYDDIVVDCPPSLGLLTVNALVAADEVIVPVDLTDEGALQGAAEVRAIVVRLARRSRVAVRALVRTMVDRRRVVYQQMSEALDDLQLPIAEIEVPLTAAFQNAAAERRPLLAWRPDSTGALAYWRLAGAARPRRVAEGRMTRTRRKLTALDDPLESAAPRRAGTAMPRASAASRREAQPGDEVQALFVRIPATQGDALARAAFELRLHKQEIVAALISRHVDTTAEGLDAVRALVEEYRDAGR